MRILHTMIRVIDLEHSINFYSKVLGMRLLHRKDYPEGEFTLAFLGYGSEESNSAIELTHNWGREKPYDLGDAYGHIAIGTDDLYATCEEIRNNGGEIVREPGPMKGGSSDIAFCKDPDGYMIELIDKN